MITVNESGSLFEYLNTAKKSDMSTNQRNCVCVLFFATSISTFFWAAKDAT